MDPISSPVPQKKVAYQRFSTSQRLPRALTIVSLSCLSLTAALTFFYKSQMSSPPKQVALTLFVAICTLGVLASVLPSRCSRLFHHARTLNDREPEVVEEDSHPVGSKGHHPTCGSFSEHVLEVRGKTYCAGCLGLFTGASVAIGGSLAYVIGIPAIHSVAFTVFWTGFFGVFVGIIQYAKPFMTNARIHYILNVVLVFGAFLLLVGVIELNGSFAVEAYLLIVILYWILTRIGLSAHEHRRICAVCGRRSRTCYW